MLYFAKWKIVAIMLIAAAGVLFALPNFFTREQLAWIPSFIPHQRIVLGLDLQGGSHMLLEVDTESVVKDRIETLRDDIRRSLRDARIGYTGLRASNRSTDVRIREAGDVDRAVRALRDLTSPIAGNLLTGGTVNEFSMDNRGDGNIHFTLTEEGLRHRIDSAVRQSIEIVRRRIDELGTTEPAIQRQGAERILVQVPGLQDPTRLKNLLGQTAKLVFRMVDLSVPPEQAQDSAIPPGSEILMSTDDVPVPYLVEKRVIVSGENLVDSQPGFDQRTNEPIVTFRFDTAGGTRFGRASQENIGRPFAIVLDNKVVSAPVIREAILGGTGQISGNFTVEEANDLAILLRAGALPAKLTIVEERTVGPGLGADSIAAGKIAAIIGTGAVIVFMLAAYGLFGIFANIALIANVSMIIALLSLLQATLTLPGIAGIVLTVGMAVDSSVLIFERIKEEAAAGKSPVAAIDTGFSRALGTILDANITTFIAAMVLFQLGSGPVRGFAVTLAIGIITTVFTAYTVTRLMVALWVRRRRPASVPI